MPTDFSENAWAAFQHARQLINEEDAEIVVMHAIDPTIIAQVVELGVGEHDEILKSMRTNALERMKRYSEASDTQANVDTLVCEGEPCFEIIRKAEDFAVDAIVMSKHGQRAQTQTLLFGSTAEKVIRGSKKPVIVLPT
ncbi:universal stress protein [Saprospiraceae bacterium]|nr:universal stress protein [Saprospiraceae bacterium]